MATSKAQRAGIWIIAIALTVGTVFGFIATILSTNNNQQSQQALAKYQAAATAYQKDSADQQSSVDKRKDELSKKYYDQFSDYKSQVKSFKKGDVKKLSTSTLKSGTGKAIDDSTSYLAYYIGFTPDGKIFDSSLDKKSLKSPLIVRPGGVIDGWSKGMSGKKIGGTYVLTIPSDQAYGEQGSGDKIKANTPLKFVVMPIETVKTLTQPEITQEVIDAYGQTQQQ